MTLGSGNAVLILAFGWLTGSVLTAAVATAKGRNGFLWGMGALPVLLACAANNGYWLCNSGRGAHAAPLA
jgi:hypothetical protein